VEQQPGGELNAAVGTGKKNWIHVGKPAGRAESEGFSSVIESCPRLK